MDRLDKIMNETNQKDSKNSHNDGNGNENDNSEFKKNLVMRYILLN